MNADKKRKKEREKRGEAKGFIYQALIVCFHEMKGSKEKRNGKERREIYIEKEVQ